MQGAGSSSQAPSSSSSASLMAMPTVSFGPPLPPPFVSRRTRNLSSSSTAEGGERRRTDRPSSLLSSDTTPQAAATHGGTLTAPMFQPGSNDKRRRPTRTLYRAEQVMEDKNMPKKRYLAMQRLRRDMERASFESLHLDINALKQQVADLKIMRSLLDEKRVSVRVSQRTCRLAIVEQYWKLAEFGIGGERSDALVTRRTKEDFVRSVMSPDLLFGGSCGVEDFLHQCRLYKLAHGHLHHTVLELQELPCTSEDVVILCRMHVRVRVSRTTIERIFPHLLGNEALVQLLIGRELVYPSEIRIHFDANGTIVRHDATVDFVYGMNNTLHCLPVVADIMDGAMLAEGSVIVTERSR